ncbi:MAG: HlyD family efflux transporter periplasmic adaptor subunit [Oscillibacter sp.]
MAEVKNREPEEALTQENAASEIVAEETASAEKIAVAGDPAAKVGKLRTMKNKWKGLPKKKRRKIIRLSVIVLVILAAAVLLFKLFGNKPADKGEVVTDTVQYGTITSVVKGSGLTKAKSSQTITLTTAGTVLDVLVTEGQQVTAGTPLFTIDSEAARTAVQKAETAVNGYEKQLRAAEKDIAGLNLAPGYPGKLMEVVKLNPGDSITKGQKLAKLSDDTVLRLQQYYSYAYAGDIHAGQSVSVSIPALMTTLTGKVEAVHKVNRITPEGSSLFAVDITVKNPGSLTADMVASATVTAGGETVYPYEAGKLAYNRTGDLVSTVNGTVISSSLVDYLQVSPGQVLVQIDGEDSEAELFALQQSLEEAQKTLETARKNLANCNAVAPIDGKVIGLTIKAGDPVAANTAVISISDTSTIIVNATVDERNISYVKAGMSVDLDQWGTMFTGMVESVSLSSTVANGVATYPMVVMVDNAEGTVNINSSISYSLVASENDNCLVLPLQCVKSVPLDDGSIANVVFVKGSKPDNAIELTTPVEGIPEGYWPVQVEIGISDNYNVEIRSGAAEGTEVFTQVQTQNSYG